MIRTQYSNSNSNSLQLVIGHVIFGLELGHVDDQLAARLVPLAVVGLLLQLLEHPFPGGAVLQGEFGEGPAELIGPRLRHTVLRHPEPQKELPVAVHHPSMDDLQDNDAFRTIGQEIHQFLLQRLWAIVFGNQFQTIPTGLTLRLQLIEIVGQVREIRLGGSGDGSNLGVEITSIAARLHDHVTEVVQQRVLVHRVLNLRHLGQILDLESFDWSSIQEDAHGQQRGEDAAETLIKNINNTDTNIL